jgi:hypothetical protein
MSSIIKVSGRADDFLSAGACDRRKKNFTCPGIREKVAGQSRCNRAEHHVLFFHTLVADPVLNKQIPAKHCRPLR